MNPGLVVKLRPTGPWRIGPDSGARNRVDFIYHSDSLYSAVTGAMARLGSLDDWLTATARAGASEVCFSSCFPFLDEIGFVIPPRTVWPPTAPALMAARIRWKSARFVPLGIVQALLAGQTLKESHWSVDGASHCLVPSGRPGPFRTDTRWSAAIDRLSGLSERHSTTCIEFRPGAGLWTIVSFRDDAARERWLGPVKAAFRLLADTGFGGERSRGWGRSETPEFVEGQLPDIILAPAPVVEAAPEPPAPEPEPPTPAPIAEVCAPEPEALEEPPAAEMLGDAAEEVWPEPEPPISEEPAEPAPEPAPATPESESSSEPLQRPDPTIEEPAIHGLSVEEPPAEEPPAEEPPLEEPPAKEPSPEEPPAGDPPIDEPVPEVPATQAPAPEPPAAPVPVEPVGAVAPPEPAPEPERPAPAGSATAPYWLLSLFTPTASDAVDWTRGNYSLLTRGGRVESPAGSGDTKKLLQMVAEGSVLVSAGAPTGGATDVGPDGFPHPVFRAGFAVAIPLGGRKS